MPTVSPLSGWIDSPPLRVAPEKRAAHVRYCSHFADDTLNQYPQWLTDLNQPGLPQAEELLAEIADHGLNSGLRRFRNHQMLRIIWHDLCGLCPLANIFANLTRLAEICLQVAVDENSRLLHEKHGIPRDNDGNFQQLIVIGMGKFGGGELNLSSDIDVIFCYPRAGQCDGRRALSNDQFFVRLARAIISSLSEFTGDGFCFRVDARLRPFGDAGPLASSMASMEQYYQNEGRDWERYAFIKARPVAGDLTTGAQLLTNLRPFVYRRYIDFGSVEAMQEMHSNVHDDARRKDRLDDIKRGPGGIREIEFLAQCFQILRGGRETSLQTPSLDLAFTQIGELALLPEEVIHELREDYVYLRRLENRIQALRDQQTHRMPSGEDLERMACAMGKASVQSLTEDLSRIRQRVSNQFEHIFPDQPAPVENKRWAEHWRQLQTGQQDIEGTNLPPDNEPMARFMSQFQRLVLSQRAHKRLDRFMPVLLNYMDQKALKDETLDRIFNLVLSICRRSAYLVLLVQNVPALERMLALFARSEWIADQVIRFPALLDELIDPSLGQQTPTTEEFTRSINRLLDSSQGTETILEGLNYLKLTTSLRIAVAQLESSLSAWEAQKTLAELAAALLQGVLKLAGLEIKARHGRIQRPDSVSSGTTDDGAMAIIAYGTLGAFELGYESDLDIVFLFQATSEASDGKRPLSAERYFARLAQRVLSFLTVITPSGKLYEVDTRLRPNGRAGALVSSLKAFHDYQLNQAWTWEMQALTRARCVAGNQSLQTTFERIRQDALCRQRDAAQLRQELAEMRQKMAREHHSGSHSPMAGRLKHGRGGLVDIEFIAQLGILACARAFPRVLQATGTLHQLSELECIDWLCPAEAEILRTTWCELSQQRMMLSLLTGESLETPDTRSSASLFDDHLGGAAGDPRPAVTDSRLLTL